MKKVIIFGKNSFVASHLDYEKSSIKISSSVEDISDIIGMYNPDVVVNCIGYCGGNNGGVGIDRCSVEKPRTIHCNLTVPTLLATECFKRNIQFIHMSSGCQFYGESSNLKVTLEGPTDLGWREGNTNPKLSNASFYSKIKAAADLAIGSFDTSLILRLRMPISDKVSPRNLISKLLKFDKVLEVENSVTFLSDLARFVAWGIENEKSGIYHVTNKEPLTHIQILEEYRKYFPRHSYQKINEEQLKELVSEPRSNCLLNTDKMQSEGFQMTNSFEILEKTMKQYVSNLKEQNDV